MITDETLGQMVQEIDDYLAEITTKYQTGPLLTGSVVLARLMLANDYMGSGAEFRKLLSEAIEKKPHNEETVVH